MEAEVKEKESKVDKLVAHVIECAEVRFDLVAIDIQEKVSDLLASIASIVIVGMLFACMLLLLSLGAAVYLNGYLHSPYLGFVIMAGVYVVLALVAFTMRKKLIKLPIINGVLKKINFHEES